MRILFINDSLPYPPIAGDKIRVYNMVRRLAEHHEVWLAILVDPDQDVKAVEHMREFCFWVEIGVKHPCHKLKHLPGLMRYLAAGKPLELSVEYSKELATRIRELTSEVDFDIVHIETSRMAVYLESIAPGKRKKLFLTLHNITSQQHKRIARVSVGIESKLRAMLYSWQMGHWEPRYAEQFDACITVSEPDRRLLLEANPRLRVEVVPNGVDTHRYHPLAIEEISPPSLLLIGSMSYTPCVDAALYLCNQILPHIKRALGQVQVWIVGVNPAPEVQALADENVHVTGRVEDVVPFYQQCTISVIPLRAGGGTRLKILEAMAFGRPVVSTTIGCEGLDVHDGKHLFIADTPETFAARTVQLIKDADLYRQIVKNARDLVVNQYDWDSIAVHLLQIYEEAVTIPVKSNPWGT